MGNCCKKEYKPEGNFYWKPGDEDNADDQNQMIIFENPNHKGIIYFLLYISNKNNKKYNS